MKKQILLIAFIFMLGMAIAKPVQAQAPLGTIVVEPAVITDVLPGNTFQVNITVDITGTGKGMFQWVLCLSWNPAILNLTDGPDADTLANPEEGSFLKSAGTTAFLWETIDYTTGNIYGLTCVSLAGAEATGSGVIVNLYFKALALGDSAIDLYGPADYPTTPIWLTLAGDLYVFATVADGSVIVIPEFPTFLVIPLFTLVTLVIVVITKKAWIRRRREHLNVQ